MLKLSSLEDNIVYQCFLVELLFEVTFLARETSLVIWNASAVGVCCLGVCFLSKHIKPIAGKSKKEIAGFIWPKLVIQTLKLSSLNENIVYQCFLAAPFSEGTFLARESCFIRNTSASRCLLPFEAPKQLLQSPLQIILQSIN